MWPRSCDRWRICLVRIGGLSHGPGCFIVPCHLRFCGLIFRTKQSPRVINKNHILGEFDSSIYLLDEIVRDSRQIHSFVSSFCDWGCWLLQWSLLSRPPTIQYGNGKKVLNLTTEGMHKWPQACSEISTEMVSNHDAHQELNRKPHPSKNNSI